MLWAIYGVDADNAADKRANAIPAHREYFAKHEPSIFFSGPQQTDNGETIIGSLYIVNYPTRAEAEAFLNNEPLYKAGVFKEVYMRRMRKGKFNPELVDKI